jgi:signal transduction histidine kinase
VASEDLPQRRRENLIANGITYAGRGGHVVVSTWTEDGSARCAARDDGPASPQLRVRTCSTASSARIPRPRAGAGLGLAICREIVLAHGGRIEVTSEDGRGSIFTFSIPMRDGGTDTNEGRAEFGK